MIEKYAWRAKIIDGKREEYVKMHNNLWPEMKQVLQEAGIKNYSIWLSGNDVFGYYECEKGIEFSSKVQAESPIVAKWNKAMESIMEMDVDPVTKAQPLLTKVFDFR